MGVRYFDPVNEKVTEMDFDIRWGTAVVVHVHRFHKMACGKNLARASGAGERSHRMLSSKLNELFLSKIRRAGYCWKGIQ